MGAGDPREGLRLLPLASTSTMRVASGAALLGVVSSPCLVSVGVEVPMAKWNSAEWAGLYSGESCPICLSGKPWNVVAELPSGFVTCSDTGPMQGYRCIVSKRHAVELHDLSTAEGSLLMADLQLTSKAVMEITGAVKMNYEIHGNTIPHLHIHLFPRFHGDPFEGQPINPRAVEGSPYPAGGYDQFVAELKSRLVAT